MKIFELARAIENALFDFHVQSEGMPDDDIARNAKVTAFYITELSKRWATGRKEPIKKAIDRSKKETRAWLRKKAQKNLAEAMEKAKPLLEELSSDDELTQEEPPAAEESVATPEIIKENLNEEELGETKEGSEEREEVEK